MLRLYHCADTRSLRCLWAIHEMGLEDRVEVTMMAFPPSECAPDFLRVNPQGTVPVLVDDTVTLTESIAILQYLVTRFGPSPLAVGPHEPYYAAWLDWLSYGEATMLAPQAVVLRYGYLLDEKRRNPAVVDDYSAIFLKRVERLDAHLEGRAFVCADRFTIADISVGYALDVANYIGLTRALPPRVKDYIDQLRAMKSYRAARRAQALALEAPPV